MNLSVFLKEYMDNNEISGRELARRCGLSPQTIFNILKGVNKDGEPLELDTKTYIKLSNGTGYKAENLMALDGIICIDASELEKSAAEGLDMRRVYLQSDRLKFIYKLVNELNDDEKDRVIAMLKLMFPGKAKNI